MTNCKKISIEYRIESKNNLSTENKNLLKLAEEACENAYAPYSKFKVGAAILLENGKIVTGNNQENAAYPSGTCAERTAAFKASADYPKVAFNKIAITAGSSLINIDKPISPCGACRQVLKEYENKFKNNIEIILSGKNSSDVHIIESIEDLLPFSFNSDDLEK